ncbi:MAG: phospholipase [Pseudomonadota bacterium]|nr:phospholipase [Pseudomonadota bacterium]QKK05162.1 MAG: phospholipase [Pseudomonadota bacterium]
MQIQQIADFSLRTLALAPQSGNPPKKIALFLHGLGSNAEDLIALAPLMAPDMPDVLFLSVDAPYPCDMAPVGYQWFSLRDRDPTRILMELRRVKPLLEGYIGEVLDKYKLRNKDLAFCGFSQGTMTSLYTALYADEPYAGVLGYSGVLFLDEDEGPLSRLPICLIHGEADDVVPFRSLEMAEAALKAQNFDLEILACPHLGHSIDEKGLKKGTEFLARILG